MSGDCGESKIQNAHRDQRLGKGQLRGLPVQLGVASIQVARARRGQHGQEAKVLYGSVQCQLKKKVKRKISLFLFFVFIKIVNFLFLIN